MVASFDYDYLATPTGQLNIAEIVCLLGTLISVGFTSRQYAELADNIRSIYPDLSTALLRPLLQAFALVCLIVTFIILLVHIYGVRYSGRNYLYFNQLCILVNILMGLTMISSGICAAFWEDKLRRTPAIVRRGYLGQQYQSILGEVTHPRPGAAAAAATFAILSGILFLIEAGTRPMMSTGRDRVPIHYTIPVVTRREPVKKDTGERVIPIETVRSAQPRTEV